MQCANYQEQLSEFLDGDLDTGDHKDVEKHLRTCAACSTVRDDLARLIAASATLPLHTPSQAVWARIEREIGSGGVVSGPAAWWNRLNARRYEFSVSARQIAAAAATVIVAVGTYWAVQYASPNALPTLDVNWNTVGGPSQPVQATPLAHATPVDEIERVRGLVDEMSHSVAETKSKWSPELRATLEKAVAAVDARISESERAMGATPTAAARETVLDAYREKLRLLDEFARLAAEARTVPAK